MEDQAPELISKFITEVGLPVSLLLGSVGCIYFLIRYVLGQIVTTIEKNQAEAREDIHQIGKNFEKSHSNLYDINVQLIKRIHRMENTLIRTNAEWRISHGLKVDEKHIGQVTEEEDN